jgi:hypothetical protein
MGFPSRHASGCLLVPAIVKVVAIIVTIRRLFLGNLSRDPPSLAPTRSGKVRPREPRRFLDNHKYLSPLCSTLLILHPFPSLSRTLSHSISRDARPHLTLLPVLG